MLSSSLFEKLQWRYEWFLLHKSIDSEGSEKKKKNVNGVVMCSWCRRTGKTCPVLEKPFCFLLI
jgi:hypothetical protein